MADTDEEEMSTTRNLGPEDSLLSHRLRRDKLARCCLALGMVLRSPAEGSFAGTASHMGGPQRIAVLGEIPGERHKKLLDKLPSETVVGCMGH